MPAIETEGLTKSFGDVRAVDDLDLVVEEGEVFGFLGPNGAGKSTTINVLLGFIDPTDGDGRVLGRDVRSESRAIRRRTGLLPEGYELYENLTGREHLASAIRTKGADDDPDELIERVGLDPGAARRAVGGYSKGMQQRLGLAIALVGDPDLLVLDEPSSGLDPKGAKLLREIVGEEADRGATVFFSSHVLGQVEQVCDRVGIMHEGEMTAVDTIDNLREETGTESVIEAEVRPLPETGPIVSVEGVQEVSVAGETIRVTVARDDAKMPVLRRLDDLTTVTDIVIEETSLESLFERYTGDATSSSNGTESGAPGVAETTAAVAGGEGV